MHHPSLNEIKLSYSLLVNEWERLEDDINALSIDFSRAVSTLAYADDVYDETTEAGQSYAHICEIAGYLEKFSRYFN